MTTSGTGTGGRLRVGVVGAGLIARVMHLHYLRELADTWEIAGICDIAAENGAGRAAEYGIPAVFTDWRELLDTGLDAVLVLTSGSHAAIAVEAANRGIHVFVEKPMCFSSREGRSMVEAAAANGTILMVGYNKRYDPAYLRFREAYDALEDPRFLRVTTLESPLLPYVQHYHFTPGAPAPADVVAALNAASQAAIDTAIGTERDFARSAYVAVLLDTLVHELNSVRGLLGEPDRIDYVELHDGQATVMLRFGTMPVAIHWIDLPGIARYEMEFAAFAPAARATLSFPSPFLRNEPATVRVEAGAPGTPQSTISSETTSYESSFRLELEAFAAAIRGQGPVPTDGIDGLRDVLLCEAIIRSFRTGAPVDRPTEISWLDAAAPRAGQAGEGA